eukprot:XP_001608945.1 transcription factor [Babesia bovis T2Bo]
MSQRGGIIFFNTLIYTDMFSSDHLDREDELIDDNEDYGGKFDFVPRRTRRGDSDHAIFKLRACLSCRLIMSEDQMDGDRRRTLDCTTANFSGLLSIMDPQKSWAARYNSLVDVIPGCYAISVVGELPESVHDDIGR